MRATAATSTPTPRARGRRALALTVALTIPLLSACGGAAGEVPTALQTPSVALAGASTPLLAATDVVSSAQSSPAVSSPSSSARQGGVALWAGRDFESWSEKSYRYVSVPQDQQVVRYDAGAEDDGGCIVAARYQDDISAWCDPRAEATAELVGPTALAVSSQGDLFIADPGAHQVFMVSAQTGQTMPVAGTGQAGTPIDGVPATESPLITPAGLATTPDGDTLFIADSTARMVVDVDLSDMIHAGDFLAATVEAPEPGDERFSPLRIFFPPRIPAVGTVGDLHIIAGPGCAPGEGTRPRAGAFVPALTASLAAPTALAYSSQDGLYIGDPGNHQVYWIETRGELDGAYALTAVTDGSDGIEPTSMTMTSSGGADQLIAVDAATGTLVQADAGATPLVWSPLRGGTERPVAVAASNGSVVVSDGTDERPSEVALLDEVRLLSTGGSSGRPAPSVPVSAAAPCSPVTSQSLGDRDLTPQAVPSTPRPKVPSHVDVPDAGSHRFSGKDRVATSVDTSKELFPKDGTLPVVVISSASSFADAAGGARYAAEVGGSLLLTPGSALDPAVKAEVQRTLASGGRILVTGREAAITPAVFSALEQLAPGRTERVGGEDRYETATKLAQKLASTTGMTSTGPIYLVTGANYPDALVVVPLARRTGGLVVLSKEAELPPVTKALLQAMDPTGTRTVPVGGAAAKAVAGLAGDAARTAAAAAVVGSDRYETARKVAERFVGLDAAAGARTDVVGLATGTDWPDALVGSTAMGSMVGPLLLNHGGQLDPNVVKVLAAIPGSTRPTTTVVFGGEKAVPASALTAFATAAKG